MLSEIKAIIAHENDDGIILQMLFLQLFPYFSDNLIHSRDKAVVIFYRFLVQFRSGEKRFPSFSGDVIIGAEELWKANPNSGDPRSREQVYGLLHRGP